MSDPEILTSENATHMLLCRHQIGRNGYDYYMLCHVLKSKSKKTKVVVFGNRARRENCHRIRYVDKSRIFKRVRQRRPHTMNKTRDRSER